MDGKSDPSNEKADAERRESGRRSVSVPCALKIRGDLYPGRLLDISKGGAFVQTAQSLTCGAELSILFRAQGRHNLIYLNLKAVVVYVGRFLQGYNNFYGFGARFSTS